jgi:D-arabinose 1-dehydrogenase-like Zn-dependent alcohol dehydrogenase
MFHLALSSRPSKYLQNDLGYLFHMLHKGKVKPPIADCISLAKVAEMQKMFEARRVQGFFVCKPWLR